MRAATAMPHMSLSIEERKLLIVERLAEMVDEGVILQIENLLQPRVEIWIGKTS